MKNLFMEVEGEGFNEGDGKMDIHLANISKGG